MPPFLLIIVTISIFMVVNNLLVSYWLRFGASFGSRKSGKPGKVQKVSVIMPVFNEEAFIVKRLLNVKQSLSEISHAHEVLIGCDGCEDKTLQVAWEFIHKHQLKNWQVLDFPNEGKGRTINKLIHQSTGDLIISTDADVSMHPHAIDLIIKSFEADESMGCLSCIPEFSHRSRNTQSFYWDIEMKIRDAESQIGKLIVVTGWLYAFRRSLFKDIPETAMADDLWVPLTILLQGFKCSHHEELKVCSEKTDEATEVKRRQRVISGGADIIRRLFVSLLKTPGLFVVVFFHKINRWLLPFWCLIVFISSLWLEPLVLIAYVAIFLLAAVCLTPRRLFYLIHSVMVPILSFFKLARKRDLSKWEHTRIS